MSSAPSSATTRPITASDEPAIPRKRTRSQFSSASNTPSGRTIRPFDISMYAYVETTGIETPPAPPASVYKTAEIALVLFSNKTNQVVTQYLSFVKLSDHDWSQLQDGAQKASDILREDTLSGSEPQKIAAEINFFMKKYDLDQTNVEIVSYRVNEFAKPFIKQVWPQAEYFTWTDLQNIFADAISKPPRFGINGMAKLLKPNSSDSVKYEMAMTKIPTPHSARSIAYQILATHQRIQQKPEEEIYQLAVTYSGITRDRNVSVLRKLQWDDETTIREFEGELPFSKGSPEYQEWCKIAHLDTSDIACIMGKIPQWKTPRQLWNELTEKEAALPLSSAQQKSRDLESDALIALEKVTGIPMRKVCIQDEKRPWLRDTLTISHDGRHAFICTTPGDNTHESARSGTVPLHNALHLLMQLERYPAIENGFVWVWHPKKGGILFDVMRNPVLQKEMMQAMDHFKGALALEIPPGSIDTALNVAEEIPAPVPPISYTYSKNPLKWFFRK